MFFFGWGITFLPALLLSCFLLLSVYPLLCFSSFSASLLFCFSTLLFCDLFFVPLLCFPVSCFSHFVPSCFSVFFLFLCFPLLLSLASLHFASFCFCTSLLLCSLLFCFSAVVYEPTIVATLLNANTSKWESFAPGNFGSTIAPVGDNHFLTISIRHR